jgi:hypothetical protein
VARAGAQGRPGEPPLVAERVLPPALPRDPDQLAPLVAEALRAGGSVLVFCASRQQCQARAPRWAAARASDALAPRWGDRQCFGGRSATSPF